MDTRVDEAALLALADACIDPAEDGDMTYGIYAWLNSPVVPQTGTAAAAAAAKLKQQQLAARVAAEARAAAAAAAVAKSSSAAAGAAPSAAPSAAAKGATAPASANTAADAAHSSKGTAAGAAAGAAALPPPPPPAAGVLAASLIASSAANGRKQRTIVCDDSADDDSDAPSDGADGADLERRRQQPIVIDDDDDDDEEEEEGDEEDEEEAGDDDGMELDDEDASPPIDEDEDDDDEDDEATRARTAAKQLHKEGRATATGEYRDSEDDGDDEGGGGDDDGDNDDDDFAPASKLRASANASKAGRGAPKPGGNIKSRVVGGVRRSGTRTPYHKDLPKLVRDGVIEPGPGVLFVEMWGYDLEPPANLTARGEITLPNGCGPRGQVYSPTGLLKFLAQKNQLQGFDKANGWQHVWYGGRKADGGVKVSAASTERVCVCVFELHVLQPWRAG